MSFWRWFYVDPIKVFDKFSFFLSVNFNVYPLLVKDILLLWVVTRVFLFLLSDDKLTLIVDGYSLFTTYLSTYLGIRVSFYRRAISPIISYFIEVSFGGSYIIASTLLKRIFESSFPRQKGMYVFTWSYSIPLSTWLSIYSIILAEIVAEYSLIN